MAFDPLYGLMGLGVAGDVFGGLSAYEQARRQRAMYDQARRLQDPNYVVQQSQPYINALMTQLRTQTPDIMRSQVNPMIGSRGIDPGSGAGQSIYAQALAPYILQAQQTGMDQYLQSQGMAGRLGTSNVGQMYGNMSGTKDALTMLMLRNALSGGTGGTAGTGGLVDPSWSGGPGSLYASPEAQAMSLNYLNPSNLTQTSMVPGSDAFSSFYSGYPTTDIGGG